MMPNIERKKSVASKFIMGERLTPINRIPMDATTESKEILFLPIAINHENCFNVGLNVIKMECRSPHLEIGSHL